ncbi:MAG TPA: methyltransferase domain-containing protein [Flavihumibacter sp.]|jgi:2-polyprenyl-3-methyl-5-hydroxy-6-metoxy-1,4-benzoquinol methylase
MPAIDFFHNWFNSPYYHKLYHQRHEDEARHFIKRLTEQLQIPAGSSLLDTACGRGQLTQYLASLGFDVTGMDLSEENIRNAQQLAGDQLRFYRHDIRLPFWINYFDYAFNFFTSFGYFNTARENANALRTISQSLKPDGYFLIDYLNVHYVEEHLQIRQEELIGDVQYNITKWFDENFFHKKIEVIDPSLEEPAIYTEQAAKYTLGDMTEMLAFQNLQIQEVYGDYLLGPYDLNRSPRMIILAKKISNPS